MISVITVCKNSIADGREVLLRKMMESLARQTCRDFEYIVIDGNSHDGTLEILQEYKNAGQIDILVSEEDRNVYEALNKGLRAAKGEFIYLINTDGYLAVDTLFELSLSVLKDHDLDYTHADRIILKKDGSPPSIKYGDERVAFFRMPFRHETMVIRRKVYDGIGFFDEKYQIASDYKFVLTMIMAGKRGYYFHQNFICSRDGGISSNRQKCIEEVTNVLFECYGEKYGLDMKDCRDIYLRQISSALHQKIQKYVRDERIRKSLALCYELSMRGE